MNYYYMPATGEERVLHETHHWVVGKTIGLILIDGELEAPVDYEYAWAVMNNAAECCGYLVQEKTTGVFTCSTSRGIWNVIYRDGKLHDIVRLGQRYRLQLTLPGGDWYVLRKTFSVVEREEYKADDYAVKFLCRMYGQETIRMILPTPRFGVHTLPHSSGATIDVEPYWIKLR